MVIYAWSCVLAEEALPLCWRHIAEATPRLPKRPLTGHTPSWWRVRLSRSGTGRRRRPHTPCTNAISTWSVLFQKWNPVFHGIHFSVVNKGCSLVYGSMKVLCSNPLGINYTWTIIPLVEKLHINKELFSLRSTHTDIKYWSHLHIHCPVVNLTVNHSIFWWREWTTQIECSWNRDSK